MHKKHNPFAYVLCFAKSSCTECCFPFYKSGTTAQSTRMFCTACMEIPGADNSRFFLSTPKHILSSPPGKKRPVYRGAFVMLFSIQLRINFNKPTHNVLFFTQIFAHACNGNFRNTDTTVSCKKIRSRSKLYFSDVPHLVPQTALYNSVLTRLAALDR